ncbi:hypothetical protein LX16_1162 [Stackebrandtia albiflava]|uniref:DUF7691 domain-containing protein n=1 Tax=Stackebrandtia albiflava TaxID=406432 RepID=A0A562VC67_9ACTN|nr:hypothetical protein [Stackebrandtia albiflava]TWJ15452.1 hypothetical protein LX16_1162 [Stackebrandtia albiflava]
MSFSLSPYLVDLRKARGAIGSEDEKLRRMIGGKFKAAMAHADDWFADQIAGGAPTRYDALRAVVDGGPFDDAYGFQYGYAFEMICGFFGRSLNNNAFSPFRSGWLARVDEGLAALGVTAVEVSEFSYGSPPAPLPRPAEFVPAYGEWSPKQCRTALAQWNAATAEAREALDPEVLEAVESCVAWMRESVANGRHVVAFHF